jgi:iron complex outermembrane receptor protein
MVTSAALWSSSAMAQAAPPSPANLPPASEQSAPIEEGADTTLGDIVVTATKRNENAQSVPISIAVLDASDLTAMGANDVKALTQAVPGLSYFSVGNIAQVYLRGVGTAGGSLGDESAVATYVDGVYQPSIVGAVFAFNNIRAIEVDKGPQGTLFGRNSTGGVMQISTNDPNQTPTFDASFTYANYETTRASVYASGGIVKGISADIALYAGNQNRGWGRNLATGADVFKSKDFAARSKWVFQLGSSTTARLALDYSHATTDTNLAFRVIPPARLLTQPAFPGFYNVNINGRANVTTESGGVSLTLDHDMDWASVKSITAYRRMSSSGYLDQDATATLSVNINPENYDRAFTQELQLISPAAGTFRWVLGAFYLNDNAGYDGRGFQVATPAPTSTLITSQKNNSVSVFGEGTVDFLSRAHLTLGARYTQDKRELEAQRYLLPARTPTAGFPVDKEATFEQVTYRGILSYDIADHVLAYVSYSKGFKGGLFNSTDPLGAAVRPTKLFATEIGIKADLLDRKLRINASVYDYDFQDLQVNQIISGANVLRNAAQASIRGAEMDIDAIPFRGLRVNGSLAYLDAKFDSFPNAPFYTILPVGGETLSTGDASGLRLPQTPEFTGRALVEYGFDTSVGRWTLQGTYYYNSGYVFSPDNRLRQDAYDLVGGTIRWTSSDGQLELSVWGNNLGKSKYLSYAVQVAPFGDHGSPSPPRSYGVTLRTRL